MWGISGLHLDDDTKFSGGFGASFSVDDTDKFATITNANLHRLACKDRDDKRALMDVAKADFLRAETAAAALAPR
jgi:hypothetical protein